MSTKKFSEALASRSPLTRREAVAPVNMYEPQVENTTSGEHHKDTSGQGDKPTNPQTDKTVRGQTHKPTKPLVEKYTTHLRPETIKAVKRTALDQDRKDYEIVQAALDAYLRGEEGVKKGD